MQTIPHKNIFVTFLFSVLLSFSVSAQWQRTNGPGGAFINCMASANGKVYAGETRTGLMMSSDTGTTWTCISKSFPYGSHIGNVCASDTNVYIVMGVPMSTSGLYRTHNSGQTWTNINTGITSLQLGSIICRDSNVFLSSSSGLLHSMDYGSNWSMVSAGLTVGASSPLLFDGTKIFLGTPTGLYVSNNNGANWNITTLLANSTSLTLNGSNVFAATTTGVFYSTNSGLTWNPINTGIASTVNKIFGNGTVVICSNQSPNIYRTINSGANWNSCDSGFISDGYFCYAAMGNRIFAGTWYLGIYKSDDAGISWTPSNDTIRSSMVQCLAVAGNYLYAGMDQGGVAVTTNDGDNWTAVNNGLPRNAYLPVIAASGNDVYVGAFTGITGRGIYHSSNNGSLWQQSNSGLTDSFINTIVIFGTNIFAGTNSGGVFLSVNTGATWTPVNNGIINYHIMQLAIAGNNILAITGNAIYRSTNLGASWSIVSNNTNSLHLVSNGSNKCYTEYKRSIDFGATWNNYSTPFAGGSIWCMYATGDSVFEGSWSNGVNANLKVSADSGTNWDFDSTALRVDTVLAIISNSNYLFVGSGMSGVWRRATSPLDVEEINSSSNFILSPNPASTKIYLNSTGEIANAQIIIYDLQGRKCFEQNYFSDEVDVSSLPTGMYFLRLISKEKIFQEKFVKE